MVHKFSEGDEVVKPLKDILRKVGISRRMIKWSVELSEFGLEYLPRKVVKAQALTDFVDDCSFSQPSKPFQII
uniref:Uncharacterized protein n=1 Tax=Gossypium raimondii TaxID=29730 RepID=A0A0D2SJH9_GOSRA|nr:hypothetical protein B456_007G249100 [Gossypium raimondii]